MRSKNIYKVLFSNENDKKVRQHFSINKTDLLICLNEMIKDGYTKFEIAIKQLD